MKNDSFHQQLLKLGLIISSCLLGPPLAVSANNGSSSLKELDSQHGLRGPSASFLLAQSDSGAQGSSQFVSGDSSQPDDEQRTISVNFNNISMVEYIRFISRSTNKNFVFDENDLQFNITLISEEPTTIENVMTALLQELRIHDLTLLEQGNTLIIHKNPKVNAISKLVSGDSSQISASEIVTQVFRLNTAEVEKIALIIKPLTSEYALVEPLAGTNQLIITDLSTNVSQIAKLIKSIDSPASGLVIGQYVVRTTSPEALIAMANKIIAPMAHDQTFIMVPWSVSNSIFVVSTPFIVERALSILQHIDLNQKATKIFDFKQLKYEEGHPSELPSAGLYMNNIPYNPTEGERTREEFELDRIEKAKVRPAGEHVEGWQRSDSGGWVFKLKDQHAGTVNQPPQGRWKLDKDGKWHFEIAPGQQTGTKGPGIGSGAVLGAGAASALQGIPAGQGGEPGLRLGRTPPGATGATGTSTTTGTTGIPGTTGPQVFPQETPREFPGGPTGTVLELPGGGVLPEGPTGAPRGSDYPGIFGLPGTRPTGGLGLESPGGLPGELPGTPGEYMPSDYESQNGWQMGPGGIPEWQGTGQQPKGTWKYDPIEGWRYELSKDEAISIERLLRQQPVNTQIPLGSREKTSFSIYKLQYRKGDSVQLALQSIADSLMSSDTTSDTLLRTLTSVQWLENSNSLIFTGFQDDLLKMRELMKEIDIPLRQVFIEMLILDASAVDALAYSVTWGSRFGGGDWAGSQGFDASQSQLLSPLNSTGLNQITAAQIASNTNIPGLLPVGLQGTGFNYGIIGRSIVNTSLGIEFDTLGALFQAIRTKGNSKIILNPKILTEDSVPAEIFVGSNIAFKTQSIATGDLNNTITNNFEYRDVGTRLRVTPFLGNNDIISLEIAQEITAIIASSVVQPADSNNAPGPNTTKSTTTTRVHLPDGYFLIISGMMRDEDVHNTTQVPCLGAIPIAGAFLGKNKEYLDTKRNQMIFIRPLIIQTEEEVQEITRRNQNIWDTKNQFRQDWIYETDRALDFLNLKHSRTAEIDPFYADPAVN